MSTLSQKASLIFHIDGDSSGFNREAVKVEGAINRMGSVFGDVFAGSLASDAFQKLIGKLSEAGTEVFNFASKMEQSKVGFSTLMGGAEKASKHIEELLKLSRSTPLEFDSIAKMSQRLQGAGIEAQKIIPFIKDIGNVAAATGKLSAERMEGISTAFSQIASKGRVSAEEMEQLAERGIPAWRILSESIGKTAAEARKMAEDGKISADQLFAAFQKFSRMNFGGAMEKQADTFSGAMDQIKNIALQTANTAFKPIYEEISKLSSKIAKSLKDQEADAKKAGVSFGFAIGEAIGLGVQQSNIGKQSWWVSVLFPWLAVKDFAEEFGQNIGKGIAKGYQDGVNASQIIPGRKTFDPSRPNDMSYLNPTPKLGPLSYDTAGTAAAKEESEKAAKERRDAQKKAFDREMDALKEHLKLQITANSDFADRNQDAWEKQFEDKKITEDRWREVSENNFKIYAAKIRELLKAAFDLDSQGKTPQEIANLQLSHVAAMRAVDGQIVRMRENREQKITGIIKTENEKRAEDNKEHLEYLRSVVDQDAADFKASFEAWIQPYLDQIKVLEMLPSGIGLLAVPTLSKEGEEPANPFQHVIDGWNKLKETMENSVGMQNILSSLGELALDFAYSMSSAVYQSVAAWALYGESIGKSLRKALASQLAHIAGVATVNALYATALGFLRLAQWDLAGAANAFLSAGLWAAIAGGSALGAKAVAGDAFKQQTERATGGAASSSSRSTNGGQVHSGQEGTVVENGANSPISRGLASNITLTIKTTKDHIVEVVKSNIAGNGSLRTAIQDAAV